MRAPDLTSSVVHAAARAASALAARGTLFPLVFLAACAESMILEGGHASPSRPSPPSVSSPTAARAAKARVLDERAAEASRVYPILSSLLDEAGPRPVGSPGEKASIAWAKRTLEEAGLTHVHTEKVLIPRWERGKESGSITLPAPRSIALTALGGSVGTGPEGLEAEVVEVDSLEAVDKLSAEKIKGKIVFFNAKMSRTRDGSGYAKVAGVRFRGAARAGKRGARGVVIRSVGTDHGHAPHTGTMRYDENGAKIPAAALSTADAEELHRLLATGEVVRLRMTLGASELSKVEGANVVGEVVGRALPDEIVLLGAHLDSWDLGKGAQDDGAGCAIIIEAARQLARAKEAPRRTVRVVLFANEENGLDGAKAYAKAHEAEASKHVLAIEADMGAGRVYEARFLGPDDKRPDFLAIAAGLSSLGVEPSAEPAEGGADLIPLRALGVPLADLRQDMTTYFDVHHTENDTLEHVVREDLEQAASAFTAFVAAAAAHREGFGVLPLEHRKRH